MIEFLAHELVTTASPTELITVIRDPEKIKILNPGLVLQQFYSDLVPGAVMLFQHRNGRILKSQLVAFDSVNGYTEVMHSLGVKLTFRTEFNQHPSGKNNVSFFIKATGPMARVWKLFFGNKRLQEYSNRLVQLVRLAESGDQSHPTSDILAD